MRWGDPRRPLSARSGADTMPGPEASTDDPEYLSQITGRLARASVRLSCVQALQGPALDSLIETHAIGGLAGERLLRRSRLPCSRHPADLAGRPDQTVGEHRRPGLQPLEHHEPFRRVSQPQRLPQGGLCPSCCASSRPFRLAILTPRCASVFFGDRGPRPVPGAEPRGGSGCTG